MLYETLKKMQDTLDDLTARVHELESRLADVKTTQSVPAHAHESVRGPVLENDIMSFIANYWAAHGRPAPMRALSQQFAKRAITAHGSLAACLDSMEHAGKIKTLLTLNAGRRVFNRETFLSLPIGRIEEFKFEGVTTKRREEIQDTDRRSLLHYENESEDAEGIDDDELMRSSQDAARALGLLQEENES